MIRLAMACVVALSVLAFSPLKAKAGVYIRAPYFSLNIQRPYGYRYGRPYGYYGRPYYRPYRYYGYRPYYRRPYYRPYYAQPYYKRRWRRGRRW